MASPKKRIYGRGSILQRRPGVWTVRTSHRTDPASGRRVREARTIRGSRRDAERALADLQQQQEAAGPTPVTGGKVTLDAWVKRHLSTSARLSPRTRADQLRLWETYSTAALRGVPLRDVSTAMLDDFVNDLRQRVSERTGRELSPRTVALVLNVIKAACRSAVRVKRLRVNPAAGVTVEGGGAVSKAGQALDADEMRRFLAVDPDHRLHALWVLAAYTGARPGELLALQWADADLDNGWLHIRRALVRVGKALYVRPCKANSARKVALRPEVIEALRRHRARQAEERLRLGDKWVDPALIFASEVGSALDHGNVAALFRRRLKAAKVRPVRWYDLRHSTASALIRAGVDHKSVAKLLGHASVVTTLAHYVHPDDGGLRTAVESLPWAAEVSR